MDVRNGISVSENGGWCFIFRPIAGEFRNFHRRSELGFVFRKLSYVSVHWWSVNGLSPVFVPSQAGLVRIRVSSSCWSTEERTDFSKRGKLDQKSTRIHGEYASFKLCAIRDANYAHRVARLLHANETLKYGWIPFQIRWEKNITLGEPPGFLHSWWW